MTAHRTQPHAEQSAVLFLRNSRKYTVTPQTDHHTMDLEDLDNLNNSDFLPLLPPNTIKEELLDAGGETASLVCDSVERQVRHSIL